jgi:hypothetical protein
MRESRVSVIPLNFIWLSNNDLLRNLTNVSTVKNNDVKGIRINPVKPSSISMDAIWKVSS